jgi:hypothetical protein
MRHLAAIVAVALVTAGCIGSTSSTGTLTAGDLPEGSPPATLMSISYTAPTCPPGVSCVAASTKQHYFIVSPELTCSPSGGSGYKDPAAACRALADVATKLAANPTAAAVCSCPGHASGYFAPRAFGWYDGKRRTIPLDGCSLCNLPGIGADLALLLPGAQR